MQTTNPWTAKATRRADYALLSLLATLLSALALAGAALLGNDLIFQAGVTTCLASLATAAAFGGAAAVAWAREETWEHERRRRDALHALGYTYLAD